MKLLIATGNDGKRRELEKLLADSPVELFSLKDFPAIAEPAEIGATFAENAILKAKYYAAETKLFALADDSGLAVEALGGAPGIYSARYGGADASYSEKIAKLLGEFNATNDENRRARFVCAMAISDQKGDIITVAEGVCAGAIAEFPRGANGFGYDPIFIPDGFAETFGELSEHAKQEISHRARAVKEIIAFLRDFAA